MEVPKRARPIIKEGIMETQHHDPVDEPTCLSRRSFFKTAAAATVATAAGAALAGCAPSTELAPTGSGAND